MLQRHYKNAPIVEAIIDIQTSFKELPSMAQFDECRQNLLSHFPNSTPIQILQMGISSNVETNSGSPHQFSHSQSEVGLRFSPDKNDRILMLQQRGFTYSHLPPYTDWLTFSNEAKRYWEIYLNTCKPESISRCAVRFINRINIPEESIKIPDYFNIYPTIPEKFSQEINGMFVQLQTPLFDLAEGAMAVTNFAMHNPDSPKSVTIVLDFDLFCASTFAPHSSIIWDTLNLFRDRKNELFEACITDKVRSLIS